MANQNRNIGLIGAGAWGKNHLRNLNNLGVLKCVLESSNDIINQRKKEFPEVEYVRDLDFFLKKKEIEGVVIAAPAEI